jgi:cysteinyl-tRNA synthetase
MSYEILGHEFDIHGGGLDLAFPHHENEIAQSVCAHPGSGFANVWMHNEMLLVEGRKMSKSLGNFFTVRDLLDQGVPGEVIRYVMLMTHYRSPMDWTEAKRAEAEGTLRKWRAMTAGVEPGVVNESALNALADDLNTAAALAGMHELAKAGDASGLKATGRMLGFLTDPLGGWAITITDKSVFSDFERRLAALRQEAAASKDFTPVDALKSALIAAGVEVRMSKTGVELVPGPGFDPAKLDALK